MFPLIQKYNVPGPRYTSYPTVPFWKTEVMPEQDWIDSIRKNLNYFDSVGSSVYIHLPFCESLCTFCGCHKRITKNHSVEEPYINALIREWDMYQKHFEIRIEEIHLGGGTPTFFRADQLKRLIDYLLKNQKLNRENLSLSFEAHPNYTSTEQLQTLFDLGFRRLSLGIQDYDSTVQQAIHRIQSFEQVKEVHESAKNMGYSSISHDLVYGLPKQKLDGFMQTIDLTLSLRPERVSLYSYAHVPWIKGNGQRGFDEKDLPDNEEKRALYENAKVRFLDAGYIEIGMDHFALTADELAQAYHSKELHRNFMGYTTRQTNLLIGLGVSAISDSWFGFVQNEKSLEKYQESIAENRLALTKGHLLSEEDLQIRRQILDLMCQFKTTLPDNNPISDSILQRLKPLFEDELVTLQNGILSISEKGKPFVRNVCMAFDQYLDGQLSEKPLFSKVI